jgi:hypothetical protein
MRGDPYRMHISALPQPVIIIIIIATVAAYLRGGSEGIFAYYRSANEIVSRSMKIGLAFSSSFLSSSDTCSKFNRKSVGTYFSIRGINNV